LAAVTTLPARRVHTAASHLYPTHLAPPKKKKKKKKKKGSGLRPRRSASAPLPACPWPVNGHARPGTDSLACPLTTPARNNLTAGLLLQAPFAASCGGGLPKCGKPAKETAASILPHGGGSHPCSQAPRRVYLALVTSAQPPWSAAGSPNWAAARFAR